jgi:hypothetical protein
MLRAYELSKRGRVSMFVRCPVYSSSSAAASTAAATIFRHKWHILDHLESFPGQILVAHQMNS